MDNKQNFYLRNMETIAFLANTKNKNEYITSSLKTATLHYRDFAEFTRKRLNPKSGGLNKRTMLDLVFKNKLMYNTIFSLKGAQIFAAKGTNIVYKESEIFIDGITLKFENISYTITERETQNDFNEDQICLVVTMEEKNEEF